MTPTIDFVSKRFAYFNNRCFRNSLPTPVFQITETRSYIGMLKYNVRKGIAGDRSYSNIRLCVSRRFDLPEATLEDIIIHEMIHYYILHEGMDDTSTHGRIFKSIMNDINARFRRNIVIRLRLSEESTQSDSELRRHIVCALRLKNGHDAISVVAMTRINEIWDLYTASCEVIKMKWCITSNPFFNRYSRTLKGKVYYLDTATLIRELEDSFLLERDRRCISTGSVPTHPDFSDWL